MEIIKKFVRQEMYGWKHIEILWLLLASTTITFLSIYWGDDLIGIVSSLTGVICVILTGKGKLSAYIFGLINTVLYAYISFGAQYYGEVMLNALYYVPMQFVGFYMWNKHINSETEEVEKLGMCWKSRFIYTLVSIICIYGYGLFLKSIGGSMPFVDSMSTCLSILAMILSVKRYFEQWILWVVIDVVTIFMWTINYINGGTDIATLIMWCVYLLNAIIMLIKWYKESKKYIEV